MSTPHVPNQLSAEQEFLDLLNTAPQPGAPGGTPPPLPQATAKIGDKEYSLDQLAQLLDQQSQELARLKKLGTLPEPEHPEPQVSASAPSGVAAKPAKWNAQTWAERTAQDPAAAQDLTLGQAWGLPDGVPASVAMNLLVEQMKSMQAQLQGQSQRTQAEILQREAERFMEQNKDYEASDDNAQVLQRYIQSIGAPPSAAAYTVAFKAAKADGVLKTKAVASNTNLAQASGDNRAAQTRLPSVRSNQSGGVSPDDTDVRSLFKRLDGMPPDAAFDYIAKYEAAARAKQ